MVKSGKKKDTLVSDHFFSGSSVAKLDDKKRFVLPQQMRYGLVEDGKLEFTIGLGLGGCLTIYKKSDIQKIVKKFKEKQHIAKFQKFFTLFFSLLHETSCDKIGRISLPASLLSVVKIQKEIVVAGVLDKIELWPKEVYDQNIAQILSSDEGNSEFQNMTEEAFALLNDDYKEDTQEMEKLSESHIKKAQETISQ